MRLVVQGKTNIVEVRDHWLSPYWEAALKGFSKTSYNEDLDYQEFESTLTSDKAERLFGHSAGLLGPLTLEFFEDGNGTITYKVYKPE